MAGKFINTNVQNTVTAITNSAINKLDNPYVALLQQKPVPVIFWNLNSKESTVDPGSGLEYAHIGKNSPFRYDKITGLFAYGFDRIMAQLEETEFGVNLGDISGEMLITPDTIKPMLNSYFSIPHLKYQCLFKVIDVQVDTLDNGSNYWKLTYELDHDEESKIVQIDKQVVGKYKVIYNNIGTEKRAVVKEEEYTLIDDADDILLTLKKYFKGLFYNDHVQTFTFYQHDTRLYDPYLIEFIIRHGLLMGDSQYTHVCHQTYIENTFCIEYDKSFFRCLEKRDLKNIKKYNTKCMGEYINDITSIFAANYESYYKMTYKYPEQLEYNSDAFVIFPLELINAIIDKNYYTNEEELYKNIFIRFFNNEDLDISTLDCIDSIDYCPSKELYYLLPMLIFCIEYYINGMLSKHEINS